MASFRHAEVDLYHEVLDGDRSLTPRLFVNGSGAAIDEVRPLLGSFAGRCPLAVADHRGTGRSSTPDRQPSMSDFADDCVALLDHLDWPQVDLIGISFGGMVAQEFACTHPTRVRRVVLMCTSSGGAGGSSYPLHELIDLPAEERRRIVPTLQDVRFDEEWLRTHDGPLERLVATSPDRSNTVGYVMQMEARRHHDVWDRLPAMTAPTLVAAGRYDGIAPLDNGRRLAGRLPNATFREYDGGHMFFLQDRRALIDLEAFLSHDDQPATSTLDARVDRGR